MLSFRIQGGNSAANRFCEATRIFTLAESLGGVESLIEVPASMTHMGIPKEQREAAGVFDDLVRISCGVEVRFSFSFLFLLSFPLFSLYTRYTDILSFSHRTLKISSQTFYKLWKKSFLLLLLLRMELLLRRRLSTYSPRVEIRHLPSTSTSRHQNFFKKKQEQITIEMMIKKSS